MVGVFFQKYTAGSSAIIRRYKQTFLRKLSIDTKIEKILLDLNSIENLSAFTKNQVRFQIYTALTKLIFAISYDVAKSYDFFSIIWCHDTKIA